MSRRRPVRPALLAAAIALGLLAGPTAAQAGFIGDPRPVGNVLWVDADGRAGPTACDGRASAATTIQAGVDAARPGDTVRVCPGRYREQVVVGTDSITLEADRPWTATVRPPLAPTAAGVDVAGLPGLVTVDGVSGVTVRGLRLAVASGIAGNGCRNLVVGILAIEAPRVRILSNRVIGGSTVDSTRCGLLNGIEVVGSPGATVAWNLVRNFRLLGIGVDNGVVPTAEATVRIFRNDLYWQHTGVECREVGSDCFDPAGAHPAYPGTFLFSEAISVGWVTAEVRRNAIFSDAPRSTLDGGIGAHYSVVTAVANRVAGADHGIFIDSSAGLVLRNRLIDGDTTGILVEGEPCVADVGPGLCAAARAADPAACLVGGVTECDPAAVVVRANEVSGYADYGIRTVATGDVFLGNNARGNPGVDCADDSGRPIRNTWTDNLGYGARPRAICSARPG